MQFNGLAKKLRKSARYCLLGLFGFTAINAVSIPAIYYFNKNKCQNKKTAVFTSGYDNTGILKNRKVVSKTIDFFMYTPITLKQTIEGNGVDWYSDASKEEFIEVILDEEHENIVVIGHGSKQHYSLTDDQIDNDLIRSLGIKKRYGEFLQYTCGRGEDSDTLEDVLYEDTKRSIKFSRVVYPNELYAVAWKDVFVKSSPESNSSPDGSEE